MLTYVVAMIMPVLLFGLLHVVLNGYSLMQGNTSPEKRPDSLVEFALQINKTNVVERTSRKIDQLFDTVSFQSENVDQVKADLMEIERVNEGRVVMVILNDTEFLHYPKQLLKNGKRLEVDLFPVYGFDGDYPNSELITRTGYTIQRQHDFTTDTGERIRFFILYGINRELGSTMYFVFNNLITLLFLGLGIMGILNYFVARSITKPLEDLQQATIAVRQGDLSQSIVAKGKDKIADLSRSFEEMRLQLVENETLRQGYEDNRKMMLSNISHDLRTPVTAIRLHADGIIDGVADSPEKLERYVRSIRQNADAMDRLLRELTILSNLDMEQEPFHFNAIRVDGFITDLVEELQFDYEHQPVRLSAEYEGGPAEVRLDVFQIRRVLVNLIENAVKYGDKEALNVHVKGKCVGNICRIEVADNGVGVPRDHLEDIFKRFYRGDEARSGAQGGGGLGLSIARRIVHRHDGDIWAETSDLGGLKIVMELPVEGGDQNG